MTDEAKAEATAETGGNGDGEEEATGGEEPQEGQGESGSAED